MWLVSPPLPPKKKNMQSHKQCNAPTTKQRAPWFIRRRLGVTVNPGLFAGALGSLYTPKQLEVLGGCTISGQNTSQHTLAIFLK